MINRETGFQVPPIQTAQVPTDTPAVAPAVNQVAGTYGSQISQRLQNPYQSYGDYVAKRGGGAPTDIAPDAATTSAVQALNALWGIKSPSTGGTPGASFSPKALNYAATNFANYFPGGVGHPNARANWDALPQYLKDQSLGAVGEGGTPGGAPDTGIDFNIGHVLNSPGAVDTEGAYNKSLEAADRQFKQYLLPQLLESFGNRGLRFSSAVTEAGAKSYGDLQANLGAQAAQARVAAQEAAAGRKQAANLGVLGAGTTRANTLANIGVGGTALSQANRAADYQDFLRFQPDAAYSAAQGFLGTRPIYPQVITGGQPVLTQNPSQLDAVNQYLNAISNIGPAVSKTLGMFS